MLRVLLAGVAAAFAASGGVTFNKDILPIFQERCQSCHRPGEVAPMSLLTYEQARPWAKAIKAAVLTRKMPPWFADPHYGKFINDRSLTENEIRTLAAWVDSGAKEGDSRDRPPAREFFDGWIIGKPDVVLSVPQPFHVAAYGTIEYQYLVIPTGFTEDKWVTVAEARPGNRAVVHHIAAFIREPGNRWLHDLAPGVARGGRGNSVAGDVLANYTPGAFPTPYRAGQARLVKAGSDIVLQIHYTANGKPADDISKIGLVFAKEKPTQRVVAFAAVNPMLAIPAGNPDYVVKGSFVLQEDATLLSLLPHMHFRGKSFDIEAIYPGGRQEKLVSVPHYDFNWQSTYYLADPLPLPKGTRIQCTAHYDNSANNKYNPDPSKEVRWGDQTWEEMMVGYMDMAVPLDKTAVDLTRPKPAPRAGAGL